MFLFYIWHDKRFCTCANGRVLTFKYFHQFSKWLADSTRSARVMWHTKPVMAQGRNYCLILRNLLLVRSYRAMHVCTRIKEKRHFSEERMRSSGDISLKGKKKDPKPPGCFFYSFNTFMGAGPWTLWLYSLLQRPACPPPSHCPCKEAEVVCSR